MKVAKTVVASQGRTLVISPNQLRQGVNIEYQGYNPYGLDPDANPGQLSLSDALRQPPAPVLQGNIDGVEVMGDAAEVAAGIAASGDCCIIS